jgi:hypothetical protein
MQNTKWNQTVEVEPPELPESFWELPGVTPVVGTIDETIGDEVMLLINDPTEGDESLGNLDTFELNVGSGSIETDYGALGFILFIVPDQTNPGQPHAVWEILFDPADPEMTEPFERLAEQSHWHGLLLGPGPTILDILEFQNTYFLDDGLKEISELTASNPCTDFPKAVQAAHDAYSLEELYQAATPETLSHDA